MAIAFVIDDEAASTTGNNVTTPGVDTSGANLIVLAHCEDGSTDNPFDSNGNTWQHLTTYATGPRIRIHYCFDPVVGAAHTFSVNTSGRSPSIAMAAFSGAASFDQESGTPASQQPGSITPAEDNELLITAASDGSVGTGRTVDAPFSSNLTASIAGGGPNYSIAMAYEIQTTATARNPTWNTATNPVAAMAAFKAAAAGVSDLTRKNLRQSRNKSLLRM